MIIVGGLLLLGVFVFAGRLLGGGTPQSMVTATKLFLPVWLVAALVNMWIGVSRAGYSVAEELPIFLAIFLIPGIAAAFIWCRRREKPIHGAFERRFVSAVLRRRTREGDRSFDRWPTSSCHGKRPGSSDKPGGALLSRSLELCFPVPTRDRSLRLLFSGGAPLKSAR
jgi:hypothetical protein